LRGAARGRRAARARGSRTSLCARGSAGGEAAHRMDRSGSGV
jgi:hypothetical protein